MFYGRNTTKQEVNLNTNFYTSYSETALLMAGAWNRQLSIQLKPCVGQDANGLRQYAEDKNQIITTSITQENAICLINGFEKEVLPALNGEKESGSVSIVMGSADSRKILTVGYNGTNAYLSIAIGLNEVGVASDVITHTFNKKSYLKNYVTSEGNATEEVVEVDLFNFIDKVSAVKDLTPVIAHSIKYNEMNRAAYSNNYQKPQSVQQVSQPTYSAPISTATSMEDFLPFE